MDHATTQEIDPATTELPRAVRSKDCRASTRPAQDTIIPGSYDTVMPVVIMPTVRDRLIAVDFESPKQHRRAVWRFAQFFRREMGYDFVQYGHDGDEDDKECVAYLWLPPDAPLLSGWRIPCVGATCFRFRDDVERMAMQWIWLNPMFRRRGMLTNAWGRFIATHGPFDVEGPFSDAMIAFLRSHADPLSAPTSKPDPRE